MFLFAAENPINHVTDLYLWKVGDTPILTMHMVTLLVVGALFVWAMIKAANAIATGPESEGNERYVTKGRFGQFVETIIVYLRDEMLVPVLGERATKRFLPYLMTVFFFILFMNVFGLIPIIDLLHLFGVHKTFIGGTVTANIVVTGVLAFVAFIVIQVYAFQEQGVKGWLVHNFGGLVPGPIYLLPVALIVFIVELLGHIIKPAALAIRLFANMVAGHTLMAVLLGFGAMAVKGANGQFTTGAFGITFISAVAAIAITFLELFVAFLQAFIFMFLTAVFLSLMSHHDDAHDVEHEEHEMVEEGLAAAHH